MNKVLITGVIICLSIGGTGCATMERSVTFGVVTGAMSGALANDRLAKRDRSQAIVQGAIFMGIVGGLSGYWIHRRMDLRERKTRRRLLFDLDKWGLQSPKISPIGMPDLSREPHLTLPKMESEWVEPQVRGKRFIEGHRVWIMTEEPQWIIPDEDKKRKKDRKRKKRLRK